VKTTFMRERLDKLRRLLDCVVGRRTMPDVAPATKPRMISSMSPDEIGPHLREMTLHCARMARDSTDTRVARELQNTRIVFADRAGSLETLVTVSSGRN
jgi:hypothetical protein